MRGLHVITLFVAFVIYGFLLVEWLNPVSSPALAIGAAVLSFIELMCVVYSVKHYHNALSYTIFVIGLIPSVMTLVVFAIWIIMGMGA